MKDMKTALYVWDRLADIPVVTDEDGAEVIDEDFEVSPEGYRRLFWQKGTDKYKVWHDIEDLFSVSIGDDMQPD